MLRSGPLGPFLRFGIWPFRYQIDNCYARIATTVVRMLQLVAQLRIIVITLWLAGAQRQQRSSPLTQFEFNKKQKFLFFIPKINVLFA